jgi:single-stranded-DNA-specific exonuclease
MAVHVTRTPITEDARDSLREFSDLTAHLLAHRGITKSAEAHAFLSPDYTLHRHDPFLMKDMDRGVTRIAEAIKNNEHIVIFSDYDADGIPGGVILHDLFKKIGYTNFENYTPDRHTEGFGLNHEAINLFTATQTKLLITVDCGIADRAELTSAKEQGIDVIVTDHHLPPAGVLPPAFAILDPKRPDCEYPDKNLCGAGVAFKLVEAFLLREGGKYNIPVGWEKWLLDLVGIATLSDMVPLIGENRVLASFGLKVLRKTRRPGLTKLLSHLKIDRRYLTEDDVAFMITPRINAASRLGEVADAFRLLATQDEAEGGIIALRLDEINTERKTIVATLSKELKKLARERIENCNVLVIGNPAWRPSLLGLVANTLVEEHNVPVFLWGRDGDGTLKGSCRAPEGVNLVTLMRAAGDVFKEAGGHAASGGFSLAQEKIHLLDDALKQAWDTMATNPPEIETSYIERHLTPDDVLPRTYQDIAQFAPFGIGNEKPIFLFQSITLTGARQFGKSNAHLELLFENSKGNTIKAIGFFTDPKQFNHPVSTGATIDLVASFEESHFRGSSELRLRIVDIL